MIIHADVAGYVLLFAVVGGLLRIEYDMPTVLSVAFATASVLFALLIAVGIYVINVGTLPEAVGYSAMGFIVLVALIGLLRDRATPA
jgi:hypothetical protein